MKLKVSFWNKVVIVDTTKAIDAQTPTNQAEVAVLMTTLDTLLRLRKPILAKDAMESFRADDRLMLFNYNEWRIEQASA